MIYQGEDGGRGANRLGGVGEKHANRRGPIELQKLRAAEDAGLVSSTVRKDTPSPYEVSNGSTCEERQRFGCSGYGRFIGQGRQNGLGLRAEPHMERAQSEGSLYLHHERLVQRPPFTSSTLPGTASAAGARSRRDQKEDLQCDASPSAAGADSSRPSERTDVPSARCSRTPRTASDIVVEVAVVAVAELIMAAAVRGPKISQIGAFTISQSFGVQSNASE